MPLESQLITIGGSNTHVLLEFPDSPSSYFYLSSALTVSYQVYRSKSPVFNLGEPTVDGFAVGNKYVAGSIITTMFTFDEISNFIESIKPQLNGKEIKYEYELTKDSSLKKMHTLMKDDARSFNIHIIFASEYVEDSSRVIIYNATFINNGQVMSINDLITEQTASFVAKDIREVHPLNERVFSEPFSQRITTASSLLSNLRK